MHLVVQCVVKTITMVPWSELMVAAVVLLMCFIWKRYFQQDELSEKNSILAVKKDELDAASRQWKNRVEQSDAITFSVAGRMQKKTPPTINICISDAESGKRVPQAKKFRGKSGKSIILDYSGLWRTGEGQPLLQRWRRSRRPPRDHHPLSPTMASQRRF